MNFCELPLGLVNMSTVYLSSILLYNKHPKGLLLSVVFLLPHTSHSKVGTVDREICYYVLLVIAFAYVTVTSAFISI